MAEDRGSRLVAGPWNRGVTTLTCYSEMASARNRRRASPQSRPKEGWMHTCVVLAFGSGLPAPSLLHLDNDTIVCHGMYCRTSGARGRRSGSLNGHACHCCLSCLSIIYVHPSPCVSSSRPCAMGRSRRRASLRRASRARHGLSQTRSRPWTTGNLNATSPSP